MRIGVTAPKIQPARARREAQFMRILITNDDGISAPALAVLEQIARDARLDQLIKAWQGRPRSEQLLNREWAKHAAEVLNTAARGDAA